jgi:hypothetical protein
MGIKDEVIKTVQEMETLLDRRTQLVKLVAHQQDEIDAIELTADGLVAADLTLTNQTKRDVKKYELLSINADYQQKIAINKSTKQELDEVDSDIQKKRFRMQGYEIVTRPLW